MSDIPFITGVGQAFDYSLMPAEAVIPPSIDSTDLSADSFVYSPANQGPTQFGGLVFRRPTRDEIRWGATPDSYVVSTVTDFIPVFPGPPPDKEGLIGEAVRDVPNVLKGDVLSSALGAAGNVGYGAIESVKSYWSNASDKEKNLLRGGAALVALVPALRAVSKSYVPLRLGLLLARHNSRTTGGSTDAGPAVVAAVDPAQAYTSPILAGSRVESSGQAPEQQIREGVLSVPIAFWESALRLGDSFEERSRVAPWTMSLEAMAGDPATLSLLRVPPIYLDETGGISHPAAYAGTVLAGGVWDTVKKIGKSVSSVAAKALKGPIGNVLSAVPGVGSVVGVIKSGADIVEKLASKPGKGSAVTAQVQGEDDAAQNAAMSEFTSTLRLSPQVPNTAEASASNPNGSVIASRTMEAAPETSNATVANPFTVFDTPSSVIDRWDNVSLPPAWVRGDSDADKRIEFVLKEQILPLEGTPALIAAAVPFLKQASVWLAVSAAPWVIRKTTSLFRTQKTPAGSVEAVLENTAPKSGFLQALTGYCKRATKALHKIAVKGYPAMIGGIKIAGLIAAAAALGSLWWSGAHPTTAISRLVGSCLDEENAREWTSLAQESLKKTGSEMGKDKVQRLQQLLMLAVSLASARIANGTGSQDDYDLVASIKPMYESLKTADPVNLDRTEQTVEDALRAAKISYVPDVTDEDLSQGGSYAAAAYNDNPDDLLGNSNDRGHDASASANDGIGQPAGAEKELAEFAEKMNSDDQLTASVLKAMQDSSDEESLITKLLKLSVPAAVIVSLVALWYDAKQRGTLPAALDPDFWRRQWNTLLSGTQKVALFNEYSRSVDQGGAL